MKIGPPADKTAAPAATAARPELTTAAPVKAGPQKAAAAGAAAGNPAISNPPTGTAAAAKAGSVESSANVQLSSTAANLISPQQSASADIDTEKVARMSQQIADKTYQVNASAIADKLIANAQELLGKVPQ